MEKPPLNKKSPFEAIATTPETEEAIKIGRTIFERLPQHRQIEIRKSQWRIVETYRDPALRWLNGWCLKHRISGDAHFDIYTEFVEKLIDGGLRNFARYNPRTGTPRRFRDYLLTVLRNQAIDFSRKHGRQQPQSILWECAVADTRDLDTTFHDDLHLIDQARNTLRAQAGRLSDADPAVQRFAKQCANADEVISALEHSEKGFVFEDRVLPVVRARFPELTGNQLRELCDRLVETAYLVRQETSDTQIRESRMNLLRDRASNLDRAVRKKICSAIEETQDVDGFREQLAADGMRELSESAWSEIYTELRAIQPTPPRQDEAIRAERAKVLLEYAGSFSTEELNEFLTDFDCVYRTERSNNATFYEAFGGAEPHSDESQADYRRRLARIRKQKQRAVALLLDLILIELANQDGKGVADWKLDYASGRNAMHRGLSPEEQQAFARELVVAAQIEPVLGTYLVEHLDESIGRDGLDSTSEGSPAPLSQSKPRETFVERLLRYQRLIEAESEPTTR